MRQGCRRSARAPSGARLASRRRGAGATNVWRVQIAAALGLALLCGACASRTSQGMLTPVAETVPGASRVNVLAVTNRKPVKDNPAEMFNGERADALSYAALAVSVPPDSNRKVGQVQYPSSAQGDPQRDFVTLSADYLDKASFNATLSNAAKQGRKSKVLVFVHGFNNRFDDAVFRFAQVVHDSKAEGIPVLFTWPSRGELALGAYGYDRESATFSRDALEQLLETLAANPNVKEVNIVAHSMGNWVTLEALRGRAIAGRKIGGKIKNVFLVAPDVDVDVFRSEIRRMGAQRPRFALFVSQDDKALGLSQIIWGGMQRIGEINPDKEAYAAVLEQEQITTFDLTQLAGDAHNRAFDDVTQVMVMVREQLGDDEPVVTSGRKIASAPID